MGGICLRRRKKALLIVLICAIILGTIFVDLRLKASILELARSNAQLKTVELMNQVVNEKVVAETQYDDLMRIHKDDQGRIVLIQANTVALNRIIAQTISELARGLGQLREDRIDIPLGQLTGSRILAGYGPKITVRMIPAGQVSVRVDNRFEQAGINQSRHLIYLEVKTTIRIAVPFVDRDVNASTIVPLAETIVVGQVPETYVQFPGFGAMFDQGLQRSGKKIDAEGR